MTKYKDPKSQALVKKLIVSLGQQHSDLTFEHFNNVLKLIVTKDLVGVAPLKSSQAAVIALGWSIALATSVKRNSNVGKIEFNKLIEHQAALYLLGTSSNNEKVSERAYQTIAAYWKQIEGLEQQYFDRLLSLEPAASVIVLLITIVRYRTERHGAEQNLFLKNREKLIEHFIKGLVTVKVKPSPSNITTCKLLLDTISRDEFKAQILPALQRSMLRSPELVLQSVGTIVHELNIDISDFSYDLGKTLIQNLYSKDDSARAEAVESLKLISLKCKDAKAIEALLKQVFAVLNGSDGKITVVEYRINILQVSNSEFVYILCTYFALLQFKFVILLNFRVPVI